jgi:hypothetical protein
MLSTKQLSIAVATGLFFWFAFAILIRMLAPLYDQGVYNAILFLACIPITWFTMSLIIRVASLREDQILAGIGVALATATLCDGLAVTWFGDLYGSNDLHIRLGAGSILWGIGLFLVVALYRNKPLAH